MTTLIGIKAGEEGVVLAADTQLNFYDDDEKLSAKGKMHKLFIGEDWALAFTGIFNSSVGCFFDYVQGKKDFDTYFRFITGKKHPHELKKAIHSIGQPPRAILKRIREITDKKAKDLSDLEMHLLKMSQSNGSVEKSEIDKYLGEWLKAITTPRQIIATAIDTGYFLEVALLNRFFTKRGGSVEDVTEFVLASNHHTLELYRIDAFGNVHEVQQSGDLDYITLGSGSDIAEEYIQEAKYEDDPYLRKKIGKIRSDNITIPKALELAIATLTKAAKDANTGGLDLVVVTKDSVQAYGNMMQTELKQARRKIYDTIIDEYNGKKKKKDSQPVELK